MGTREELRTIKKEKKIKDQTGRRRATGERYMKEENIKVIVQV